MSPAQLGFFSWFSQHYSVLLFCFILPHAVGVLLPRMQFQIETTQAALAAIEVIVAALTEQDVVAVVAQQRVVPVLGAGM